MQSWKDIVCAVIGVMFLAFGHVYVFALAKPPAAPSNGRMFANHGPAQLYPACNVYPDGLNGIPCADSDLFEQTGQLVLRGGRR
jgi:hypothetical protein